MKFTLIMDKDREEELLLYLNERRAIADEVESLIENSDTELFGYADGVVKHISEDDIYVVYVENGRVIAETEKEKFRIKQRLYEVEAHFSGRLIKINQSCLVAPKKIEKFVTSIGGSLSVVLKNGYRDYVSRRQLSVVKRAVGIK